MANDKSLIPNLLSNDEVLFDLSRMASKQCSHWTLENLNTSGLEQYSQKADVLLLFLEQKVYEHFFSNQTSITKIICAGELVGATVAIGVGILTRWGSSPLPNDSMTIS